MKLHAALIAASLGLLIAAAPAAADSVAYIKEHNARIVAGATTAMRLRASARAIRSLRPAHIRRLTLTTTLIASTGGRRTSRTALIRITP
jgi:hypothetical protein